MARNDVYLNINALSPADAVVTGQQDMTAATVPELVLGDTPTFNFYFTDNTNVWPSWAGNTSYSLTWALSDAVAGDFSPAATTGNATPITGGWSVVLPLNSYDLVGLLNTKRVGQPYPVTNLWQQLRVTDPSGNEITRAMFWTPVRYRAISDTQNTESASPTGGRFVTVNNVNTLTTPTAAQFYSANPVPTSALGTASNGQLLIGNGTGFTKATLTAGTGVSITNGSGSITIDASGAQETLTATVKNAESVAITKGQVVYLFGATGGFASVKLAYNTSDATSAKTFGVVSSTSIAANGTGTVTCVGVVDGLNLGAYNDGDTLYLGATPGSVTATKPYAPNHLVYVGIVERANNGNGELYVRVQNGYELDEIHDVQINAPKLAGQTLIYDQTNDLWKNARLTGTANQITVTNADAAVTLSIPTNPTLPGNLTVNGTGTSTFGGNLTVSGGTVGTAASTNLTLAGGSSGASLVLSSGNANSLLTAKGSTSSAILTLHNSRTTETNVGLAITNAYPNAASRNWAFAINNSAFGDLAILQSNALGGDAFTAGTSALYISPARNLVLGTTTDSSNGKLQLATHTTSAGGIGFGTDVSLYRVAAGALRVDNTGAGDAQISVARAGVVNSTWYVDGSNVYLDAQRPSMGFVFRTNGSTTALTLDASQNATFAGTVTASGNISSNAVFGSSSGTLYLRPNGISVASGQATIDTSGNLTVSGTGTSSFASGSKLGVGTTSPGVTFVAVGAPATLNYTIGSTSLADIRSTSAAATNAGPSLTFSGYYQTSVNTSTYGAIKGILQGAGDGNSAAGALTFLTANGAGSLSEWARITNSGNVLLGTTTDSGNGKLQLATHTTSAGGIGFGTDTSLYRTAAGEVGLDALSGTATVFGLRVAGTRKSYLYWENGTSTLTLAAEAASSSLKFLSANALALTLDSSQNATFAGKITNTGELYSSASTFNFYSNSSASIKLATLENIGSNNTRFNIWNNSSPQVYGLQIETSGTTSVGIRARNLALNLSSDNGTTTVTNTTASSSTTTGALVVSGGVGVAGAANIGGAIAIGNTVQTAASVASTHKVTIVIGGVTYYLLATNV